MSASLTASGTPFTQGHAQHLYKLRKTKAKILQKVSIYRHKPFIEHTEYLKSSVGGLHTEFLLQAITVSLEQSHSHLVKTLNDLTICSFDLFQTSGRLLFCFKQILHSIRLRVIRWRFLDEQAIKAQLHGVAKKRIVSYNNLSQSS